MPFHPNSFSHDRLGDQSTFTVRFANNWALSVMLPEPFTDSQAVFLKTPWIEVSVMSGQRLLELDKFGSTTLSISPDMYAGLLMSCQQMPEYDPNSDANETEVAAGIGSIRRIVTPSYSHSNSKKA